MNKVIVIGGGPGGLAAAVALRRVGIDAAVFERAPELREVGARLSLWSNAVTALRRLGLEEAVVACSTVIERALTLTAAGRLLSDAPLGDLGRKAGAPSVCVHRADLQQVVAAAVGTVHLGAECVGVEEDAGGVTVHYADGRAERGAVLIGADGIRSAVRAHLHGPTEPRRAGYVAYRGIARGDLLPESPPDRSRLVLGPGAQAGIFPCGDGRAYWFATAPAPDGPPVGSDHKAEAMERFRSWLPLLKTVIGATEPPAMMRHDIVDLPPVWPWGRGRVSLLGDAAHATTPNLGQGACQALEDAVVLANCLAREGVNERGLRRYEEARRRRTEWVVRLSRSMGKVFQWKNPLAVWFRNRRMSSLAGQRQATAVLEELLGYDLPDLPTAQTLFAARRG